MISRLFVIASGGLLCYSKSFIGQEEFEDDLISGFLTAISNFAQEIKGGGIKALNFRNFNYVYSYDTKYDCMFVLVTDINDIEEEARIKVDLLKNEFVKRYDKYLEHWIGEVTIFEDFHGFVEENIFIPPKILLIGEPRVGKTTILNLFPGETILELDEDLKEIMQKPVDISEFKNIKQIILREIDMEDLVNNTKIYRELLDSVEIICIVTNSASSNLGRTLKLFTRLKSAVNRGDFYVIANFQDLKNTAFDPGKIEESFNVKTFGYSATRNDSKEKIMEILKDMIQISIIKKREIKD